MKGWGRWSKLTLMGALFAELLLPSPSAIGARWSEGLSFDLRPMQIGVVGFLRWDTELPAVPNSAALSAAIAEGEGRRSEANNARHDRPCRRQHAPTHA